MPQSSRENLSEKNASCAREQSNLDRAYGKILKMKYLTILLSNIPVLR